MAISYVKSGSGVGTYHAEYSLTSLTAGQLITAVAAFFYTSSQTPTAADLTQNGGAGGIGTPTLDKYLVLDTGNAPYYLGLAFYSVLVTSSGSVEVRVDPNGGSVATSIHASVWDGTWDSSRVENAPAIASSTTDNQTSWASASATSAGAALFLSGLGVVQTNNNAITKDAAYTLLTSYQDGTTQTVGGAAYHLVSSGTSEASTWTGSGSTNYGWASGLVVYKEVASSSPTAISIYQPTKKILIW